MAAQDGNKVLVIDNGGSCIKAGFNKTVRPHVKLANWISQSKKHAHLSSIGEVPGSLNSTGYIVHRPVKAGLLLDIDNQVTVWSHVFDKLNIKEDSLKAMSLALTEGYGTSPSIHQELEECCFEQLGFAKALFLQSEVMPCYAFPPGLEHVQNLTKTSNQHYDVYTYHWAPLHGRSSQLRSYITYVSANETPLSLDTLPPARLCVNLGYSSISAFPTVKDVTLDYAIYKSPYGGKFLDSQFKRAVCLRHGKLDFYDWALSQLREKACVLSSDPTADMIESRQPTSELHYIQEVAELLPGGKLPNTLPSRIVLGPERFSVYESLFHPGVALGDYRGWYPTITDAKMNIVTEGWKPKPMYPPAIELSNPPLPAGLPDAIVQALFSAPPIVQSDLASNIVLTGGLVNIPGLVDRLIRELRTALPSSWPVVVTTLADQAEDSTWLGTVAWSQEYYSSLAVTREEYFEGRKSKKKH